MKKSQKKVKVKNQQRHTGKKLKNGKERRGKRWVGKEEKAVYVQIEVVIGGIWRIKR